MSYGYSNKMAVLIEDRHEAEPDNILYAVLLLCVAKNIVPSEVAQRIGVTKQAVYDWIQGKYAVNPVYEVELKKFLKELRKQPKKA